MMDLLTMKDLSNDNELSILMSNLWKAQPSYCFNLFRVYRKDKIIYALYVYPFSVVDGVRVYKRPRKIYRNRENIKEVILYITERGL